MVLDKAGSSSYISEARACGLPVISYTDFVKTDFIFSFLFFGDFNLYTKKNNFFFFLYLLKNMVFLESALKKKKIARKDTVKSTSYRLSENPKKDLDLLVKTILKKGKKQQIKQRRPLKKIHEFAKTKRIDFRFRVFSPLKKSLNKNIS